MTAKRRSSLSADQLAFTFDAPAMPTGAAELAGLGQFASACVARAMREDGRDRRDLAAEVSKLLDDDVTHHMLNAYASESREDHRVPIDRFLAIIVVTKRFDVLDAMVKKVGARLLVGEEIMTAELGHIDRQIAELKARRQQVAAQATPIERRGAIR